MPGRPRYGDPDGYGRYGMMETDTDGNLQCHECGAMWKQLATHVRQAHGIAPAAYREAHGLGATFRLVSQGQRDILREKWHEHADLHLKALDESRDPQAAHAVSVRRTEWAPQVRAKRSQAQRDKAARDLTPEEIASLGDPLDIPEWTRRARLLRAQTEAATQVALAKAAGISPGTVSQRFRRYPV